MSRAPRAAALLLPLLLVNTAAVYGQAGWAYDHLARNWVIAALFAASVESIGIYLAYEAHAALMAGDASARLRLGSYLVGVLAGALNFAHFAPGYRPNPLAVTFGVLSSISPWLWAIRSRSLNRDRLRELGQVDPRAVRFSVLRWVLFPVRTVRAFRAAVWAGIVQPAEAIAAADARRAGRRRMTVTARTSTLDMGDEVFALAELTSAASDSQVPAVAVSDAVTDTNTLVDQAKRTRRQLTTAERILRLRDKQPDLGLSAIARKVGVSERTVSRHLDAAAETTPKAINGAALADLESVT